MALVFESLQLDILLGIFAFIPLLYLYLTRNFNHWKKKGIINPKPVPFFGNIKEMVVDGVYDGEHFKKIYDAFEGEKYVGCFQFNEPSLLVRDPDIIKDVLVKNFSSFHDRGLPVDEERHPLSAHLFNLPGPRWRALRAKLTPTFTSGKMKMMYHLMEECSEELRRHLNDPATNGEELEMREAMARFTTDIIGSCAFGLQMNSMKDSNSEFRRVGRLVFEPTFSANLRRLTLLFLNPIAKLLDFSFEGAEVEEFFLNAVKDTVNYREKNNVTRNDFIQLLIQLKNKGKIDDEQTVNNGAATENEKDSINMTDGFLAAQAFVFFLAGFETSSTLLSFALYELALNPDVQEQLREEVDITLKKSNGKLSYESLQDMPYLDKVVDEALRKYPPVGILVRQCTKPYVIPETDIELEKDTRLIIPVLGLHRDPKIYPEPDKFDPERFSEEGKASRHHFTYLPFGEGPRNCIGMRFGLLQSKLGLVSLLRDFKFSPSKRTAIPIRYARSSLVTASADGIYLKISRRD